MKRTWTKEELAAAYERSDKKKSKRALKRSWIKNEAAKRQWEIDHGILVWDARRHDYVWAKP